MIIKTNNSMNSVFIDEYATIKKENLQLRIIAERLAVEKQNLEINLRLKESKIEDLEELLNNDKC